MKKIVAVLLLFVSTIFIALTQPRVTTYVDSMKAVTVNVTSENKKPVIDNLQLQLIDVVKANTATSLVVSESIANLNLGVTAFVREIEKRNKNDGALFISKFNYSTESIKKIIRVERWLNFLTYIFGAIYLLYIFTELNKKRWTMDGLIATTIVYYISGILLVFIVSKLLTLIFNGDYYVIKELITLYK